MADVGMVPVNVLGSARAFALMSRGEEDEAVEHTKPGAPTKSIAAFKTFVGVNEIALEPKEVEEKLGPWVNNLVSGLVRRVRDDSIRNKRYAKTLCVYFCKRDLSMKSRRTVFPGAGVKGKEEMVKAFVLKALMDSHVWPIVRVGVAAENFVEQGDGLGSFFGDASKASTSIFESSSASSAVLAKAKAKDGSFFGDAPKSSTSVFESSSASSAVPAKAAVKGQVTKPPWSCAACTYVNKASRLTCEICGEANRGGVQSSFVCPKCTFENAPGSQQCDMCGETNGTAHARRRRNETEERATSHSPAKKKKKKKKKKEKGGLEAFFAVKK